MNSTYYGKEKPTTISEAILIQRYNLSEIRLTFDASYSTVSQITEISEVKAQIIPYIAGYVAHMAMKKVSCMECCQSLGFISHTAESEFLEFKDMGGLFKPTQSVTQVCKEAEICTKNVE